MIPYPPAKVKGHGSIALDLLVMAPWHGRVLPVMCCWCVLGMRQLSCRIDNAVGKCKLFGDSSRANRMVGGAHYVHKLEFFVKHVRVFPQYKFVLRVIRVELILLPLTYRYYYSNKEVILLMIF